MDRDRRWDRVKRAYEAIVDGQGDRAGSATEAVSRAYEAGQTDEFVEPAVMEENGSPIGSVEDGDGFFFFNFRADRARELTRALTAGSDWAGFDRPRVPALSRYATMTLYEEDFPFDVAFPPLHLKNILGEVVSAHGLRQLRIAETEKYAHVTYFFNGGEEEPFPGEDRCLVHSPRDVATYDLKPEMSAVEVTDEVIRRIDGGVYDMVVLNYANPDMVGHTGVLSAAVKAVETVDSCLARVIPRVEKAGGVVLITADHGNCEEMIDDAGGTVTAHSTARVPLIVTRPGGRLRTDGILADIAPTILGLLGLDVPEEMTGKSLLIEETSPQRDVGATTKG
jgi:2,3-bisphosphoglycerate-independent phosphoglycerate mutase